MRDKVESNLLSIDCLTRLGLNESPFVDHARDLFIYTDEAIDMSINVLIDYLRNHNNTLSLIGGRGAGKTAFLRILLRRCYQDFNFCTLRAKTETTFSDIEAKVRERWRSADIKNANELVLEDYITNLITTNKRPVLILDDAHRLNRATLDALLRLKHRVGLQAESKFGLVFGAEPSIQTHFSELSKTNPACSHIYQVNVRGFDLKQTKSYLTYRLEKAGLQKESPFTEEQIGEIYKSSFGTPRLVNQLAAEKLAQLCAEKETTQQQQRATSKSILQIGLISIAIVGTIIAAILFSRAPQQPSTTPDKIELQLPPKTIPPVAVEKPSTAPREKIPTKETTVPEIKVDKSPQTSAPRVKVTIHKPYVAPLELRPMESDLAGQAQESQPASQPVLGIQTKEWILSKDPQHYTIQVLATSNLDSLKDIFNKHKLTGPYAYYLKSQTNNKRWYVLIYGDFASRDEAQAHIRDIPQQFKGNQPYIIQIKDIQKVVAP